MLNAGSIEKNSQESRNLLIINKSDKSFKLYLDGGYIGVVNCSSEMNLPLSCAGHTVSLIQIPVNLFKFAGITLACSIENLVTQGCGSLPEKMESILTRSDFSIDIDIIGDTTMLIADDVAIVSEDVNSTPSYDKSVQKRADKKRAVCFLMLYVLPIFLLLITVSVALLCIAAKAMSNGYIKESLILAGVSFAICLIVGFVLRNSKKLRLIRSVIKQNFD